MDAESLCRRGVDAAARGRLEDAFGLFQQALERDPRHLDARLNAARLLLAHDYRGDAIELLLRGFKTQARDPRLRHALAAALEGFPLEEAGPAVRGVLLDLCLDDTIATQALADAVMGLARHAPGFPAPASFTRDPLFAAVLERGIVNDEAVERALTALRADLLFGRAQDVPQEFVCALARQCFNNEYAWAATPEEQRAASALRPADEAGLARVALYRPLHRIEGLRETAAPSPAFERLWRAQVAEPREEAGIAAQIAALTPVRAGVSSAVRAMYEENPYPRWLTVLRPPAQTLEQGAPRRILVAGCGTGQHPVQVALRFPESEVLAVDLSRASLAYAARMARRFGAANLRFGQADILELGRLPGRFDVVESLGVLHHLEDPIAGWRVLAGLLADDGLMRIALYSERARQPLRAAREHLAGLNLPDGAEGIRIGRRAILDLPAGHPGRAAAQSDDFFSASGFRDLLLHVQEQGYTPARIAEVLDLLGLRFRGFDAPPAVAAAFMAEARDPSALLDLRAWDRFETRFPESFRAMFFFTCSRA